VENNFSGDWAGWSKHVLKELVRLSDCYEKLDMKLDSLRDCVTILQVKAAGLGAIAGLIMAVIAVIVKDYIAK